MSGGSVEPRLGDRGQGGRGCQPRGRQGGQRRAVSRSQVDVRMVERGEEHKGRLDEGDDGAELREKAGDI